MIPEECVAQRRVDNTAKEMPQIGAPGLLPVFYRLKNKEGQVAGFGGSRDNLK